MLFPATQGSKTKWHTMAAALRRELLPAEHRALHHDDLRALRHVEVQEQEEVLEGALEVARHCDLPSHQIHLVVEVDRRQIDDGVPVVSSAPVF